MKNIALINGTRLRPPAFRPVVDGKSAFALSLEFAAGLPHVQDIVVFLSERIDLPPNARAVVRPAWTVSDLLAGMDAACEGHDHAFYFFADCPFLDLQRARAMFRNHTRYWADYTFADGFPAGISAEILTRQTMTRLRGFAAESAGASAPARDTLFSLVSRDINSFDIETEISDHDMRLLRLSLTADTERNFLLLQRTVEAGARVAGSACEILRTRGEIHRTLPAFFPLQVVERCPQACSYCPYPGFGGAILETTGAMPVDRFAALIRRIAAWTGDAVVDISLWGEPSLHPQVFELIGAALEVPGIDLVIETSGVGWQPGLFARIRESFAKQPTWIVSLDAASETVYRKLRGSGFVEAHRAADELIALFPATAWVQAVRMKENEEDLEVFYRTWKARTDNVIIQKYDSFCGTLPDRTVADLSPLRRSACWHLKRDMAVLLDGRVPLCREDIRAATVLGNAFDEELSEIWDRSRGVHRAHLDGTYPGICAACDEHYTYNY